MWFFSESSYETSISSSFPLSFKTPFLVLIQAKYQSPFNFRSILIIFRISLPSSYSLFHSCHQNKYGSQFYIWTLINYNHVGGLLYMVPNFRPHTSIQWTIIHCSSSYLNLNIWLTQILFHSPSRIEVPMKGLSCNNEQTRESVFL